MVDDVWNHFGRKLINTVEEEDEWEERPQPGKGFIVLTLPKERC